MVHISVTPLPVAAQGEKTMNFGSENRVSPQGLGALLAAVTVAVPLLLAAAFPGQLGLVIALSLAVPFASMSLLEGLVGEPELRTRRRRESLSDRRGASPRPDARAGARQGGAALDPAPRLAQ
jgi:hypothetical protein